jgi:NAD(P)-dependent dehydrogenase (short-subunit alcohol dehydrogenase family)
VTGAGRGIGRAVARRLSEEGLRVALVARNPDELAGTAAGCAGPTLVVPADVTSEDAVERAFGAVERAWGPVEVLVAAAGAGHSARVERTSDADWQRMLDLNLTAVFRCTRRAVPAMRSTGQSTGQPTGQPIGQPTGRSTGWGRIVVIASTAAVVGEPYITAYAASKHGVLGLVRSAAAELAGHGITVNAVCPGYVDTPMTDATVAGIVAATGRTEAEARRALERRQAIGRLITPDEVAEAVWLCVVDGAVNGQAITVDGGAVR